jgi:hypothetical protein
MFRFTLSAILLAAASGPVWAQAAPTVPPPDLEIAEGPQSSRVRGATAGNGGWLYADSTTVAAPGQAALLSRFTLSNGDSPTRPFASNLGSPGAMLEVGGEIGLLPGLSVQAVGVQGESYSTSASATGAVAGLRWSVLPSSFLHTHLVLSGGWLHELNDNANGTWARVAFGWDSGALRTQVAVHGEHVFAPGRDGLDVMVTAGASLRVLDWLRAGVEYVGQDLEETFDAEAEGGARHLLGPTATVSLLQEKLSLVAGPAVVLAPEGTRMLGRMALSYAF